MDGRSGTGDRMKRMGHAKCPSCGQLTVKQNSKSRRYKCTNCERVAYTKDTNPEAAHSIIYTLSTHPILARYRSMTSQPGFTLLLIKDETHKAVRQEASAKGMKIWAVAELAFNDYFHKNGGID
jgi:hypothetical protein